MFGLSDSSITAISSIVVAIITFILTPFITKYADRKKIFESILLNKLEGFYSDLGWTLNLNPYKEMFFKF